MTRIIAGRAGGRRLRTPSGSRTRPTSDRVREALFSSVESWCGNMAGLRFLDLYAGSGAVGLEAWSRGAAAVTFVESDPRTASLLGVNARDLGFTDAEVHPARTATVLRDPPRTAYDVVFSDPPYDLTEDELARDLRLLVEWVAPGALVVVERSSRSPVPAWPARIAAGRSKRYGETALWYGHATAGEPETPAEEPA